MSEALLAGNGAALVAEIAREVALAKALQGRLERLYRLDRVVDVGDFAAVGEEGDRETLWVRNEPDGGLAVALRLPPLGVSAAVPLDRYLQIVEGVSHFVYLAERWRRSAPVSKLELETQAEIDKYVVLAAQSPTFDRPQSADLRDRLYARAEYLHAAATEEGDRYRTATRVAAKFTEFLEHRFVEGRQWGPLRRALLTFFHAPREEKQWAIQRIK
jgi:hypothetical protein